MEIGLPSGPAVQQLPQQQQTQSLYQQGLILIEKLHYINGFEMYLFPNGYPDPSFPIIDPVSVLWHVFRLGVPLAHLVSLYKNEPFQLESIEFARNFNYGNVCKKAVYHFLVVCKNDEMYSDDDLFNISELYKDDTNVFVRVLRVVDVFIEKLIASGKYPAKRDLPFKMPNKNEIPTDNRSKVISELLETERKYVESLEKLMDYQNEIQSQNLISKDKQRSIFANLDQLLDFQRRFLISMEATLSLPYQEQRIGVLFLQHEKYFEVYIPFCANYQSGIDLAVEEALKLQKVAHIIDPSFALGSYLIKPVQRVCKYPLLLNELIKYSEKSDYPYIEELKLGLESVKRIADQVNEEKRQKDNEVIKQELFQRIEDWRGLNGEDFGDLLLHDKFPMSSSDIEYHLYLFDRILLCCKENLKKKKKRNSATQEVSYLIKGNISVSSITGVLDVSNDESQYFELKVYWTNHQEVESFLLRCRNEELAKQWKSRLDKLVADEKAKRVSNSNSYIPSPRISSRGLNDESDYDDGYSSRYTAGNRSYTEGQQRHSSEMMVNHSPNMRRSVPLQPRQHHFPPPSSSDQSLANSAHASSSESIQAFTRRSSPPAPNQQRSAGAPGGGNPKYHPSAMDSISKPPSRQASKEQLVPQSPVFPSSPQSFARYGHHRGRSNDSGESGNSNTGSSQQLANSGNAYEGRRGYDGSSSEAFYESRTSSLQQQTHHHHQPPPPQSRNNYPSDPPPLSPNFDEPVDFGSLNPVDYRMGRTRGESAPMNPGNNFHSIASTTAATYSRRKNSVSATLDGIMEQLNQSSLETEEGLGLSNMNDNSMYSGANSNGGGGNYLPAPAYPAPSGPTPGIPVPSAPHLLHQPIGSSSLTFIKIKAYLNEEIFMIALPLTCSFQELHSKLDRKIRLCAPDDPRLNNGSWKIRYRDEYGDFITIRSDDDVQLAFDGVQSKGRERVLQIFIQ